MRILRRCCCGSVPIPTRGLKPSPASDPNSVSPLGCFPIYAILQITSAGGGAKALRRLVPPSHHHRRNWPDPIRAQQPILCRSGAIFYPHRRLPASHCFHDAGDRPTGLTSGDLFRPKVTFVSSIPNRRSPNRGSDLDWIDTTNDGCPDFLAGVISPFVNFSHEESDRSFSAEAQVCVRNMPKIV